MTLCQKTEYKEGIGRQCEGPGFNSRYGGGRADDKSDYTLSVHFYPEILYIYLKETAISKYL